MGALYSAGYVQTAAARALKWLCLLRHVCGVVWTISQNAEEKEREGREERNACWGQEKDRERTPGRGMGTPGCSEVISQRGGICGRVKGEWVILREAVLPGNENTAVL